MAAALLGASRLSAQAPAPGAPGQAEVSSRIDVSGLVVDSQSGQPLATVQVVLVGTTVAAVTDDSGTFRLSVSPPGAYVLEVSAIGYHSVEHALTLRTGEPARLDVVLTPSSLAITDHVTVTASAPERSARGASDFTLEGHELANLGSVLADDPLRAAQSLPGVTSNNDFSSEFSVRGAPFRRVGLYLDGVLLRAPFHTTNGAAEDGSLSLFSGDLTDSLTLYQGAWPVRFSGRTAGMLAVDTRQGTRDRVRAQVGASASNATVLAEGPIGATKRGAWIVAARKSYLQYILDRVDFGDQAPFVFGFTDVQARVDYDLTPSHAVSLNVLDGTSAVDRSRYREELTQNTLMTSAFRTTVFNLGSRYVTKRWLVTSRLAWAHDAGHAGNRDSVLLSDTRHDDVTMRSDISVPWSPRGTFEAGAQLRRSAEQSAMQQIVYAPTAVATPDRVDGIGWEVGEYVQGAMQFGQVRLTAGLRHDAHSLGDRPVNEPYASVSLSPRGTTRVELDWGRYAQFPEVSQYRSTFTQRALDPERATHVDLLVERQLSDRLVARVEVYDREDRDLLARPGLDPRLAPDGTIVDAQPAAPWLNAQRGHARGAQFTVQRRSANGLTGWLSYAYGQAIIEDQTLQTRFSSDYDQRHTVNLFVSRRLRPTVNVSGRYTFGSGMPFPGFYGSTSDGGYVLSTQRNRLRATSYQRADVRVNKVHVGRRYDATLYAELVNATNHTNRDFDAPGPYDRSTGQTSPSFFTMLPILPSLGVVVTFGHTYRP